MKKYKTIVIDPPWELKMGNARSGNGIANCGWNATDGRRKELAENYIKIEQLKYPSMTIEELASLKIPYEKDAHVYIWTINSKIEETYMLARRWGLKPIQLLTWAKNPMGLGMGGAFCQTTEHILFCRKGNLKTIGRVDRSWWNWKRGKHSQKPEHFQDIVEKISPPNYLEMFARREREDWDVWGNEVVSDVVL